MNERSQDGSDQFDDDDLESEDEDVNMNNDSDEEENRYHRNKKNGRQWQERQCWFNLDQNLCDNIDLFCLFIIIRITWINS